MHLGVASLRDLAGDVFGDEDPPVVPDVLRQLLPVSRVFTEMEGVKHRYGVSDLGDREGFDPLMPCVAERGCIPFWGLAAPSYT